MRWVRALSGVILAALAATIVPVVLVRFVDPPFTWTMVGVVREQHARTGTWRWVDYRPRDLAALGPCPKVVVAAEDNRFWHHHGFDYGAIQEAIAHNTDGGTVHGASTIDQQVARNVFLWQGRTWVRKGLEAWMTVWLDLIVPKSRILELYCNVAQTGPDTFGFEAGAERWYRVPARKLTLDQGARIAAILPSPSRRDPREQGTRARGILRRLQPFPGEPGFEAAAKRAAPAVRLGTILEP